MALDVMFYKLGPEIGFSGTSSIICQLIIQPDISTSIHVSSEYLSTMPAICLGTFEFIKQSKSVATAVLNAFWMSWSTAVQNWCSLIASSTNFFSLIAAYTAERMSSEIVLTACNRSSGFEVVLICWLFRSETSSVVLSRHSGQ